MEYVCCIGLQLQQFFNNLVYVSVLVLALSSFSPLSSAAWQVLPAATGPSSASLSGFQPWRRCDGSHRGRPTPHRKLLGMKPGYLRHRNGRQFYVGLRESRQSKKITITMVA